MKLGILIYFIILTIVDLLVGANLHGKPREGKYNFFITLTAKIISLWIPLLLLYFYC